MGKHAVTDYYVYRWRHTIGFILLGVLLLALLYTVGFLVPGGVSNSEMASSVGTSHVSLSVLKGDDAASIVHLPYRFLQRLSFKFLGISDLSIKLPSLVLAFVSVVLIFGLLRLWFQRNTAIITSIIVVTTGQFLLTAQLGTPDISYLFWNSLLLFSTSMLAKVRRLQPLWLLVASVAGALSLYSPLEIYVVLALAATCLIHPHARFIVFKQKLWVLALGLISFLILVAPLVLTIIKRPSLALDLLGVPSSFDLLSWSHATDLLNQYVGIGSAASGEVITPAFGIVIFILALLGLYRLFTAKYTAKSYIITIWTIFLIPIIIFQSSAVNFVLVPLILLVAFAVDHLIRSWYNLFPLNPYARIAGLLPLAILFGGLIVSNIDRFVYGYHYDPKARTAFTEDVSLLRSYKGDATSPTGLLIPSKQKEFYELYALHNPSQRLTVASSPHEVKGLKNVIVSREFKGAVPGIPDQIFITDTAERANRFYLYKNLPQ